MRWLVKVCHEDMAYIKYRLGITIVQVREREDCKQRNVSIILISLILGAMSIFAQSRLISSLRVCQIHMKSIEHPT